MKYLSFLLLMVLCMAAANAQPLGEIQGKVTDETGEAIIGAVIQAFQKKTTISSAVTDYDGNYAIKGLSPGKYDVQAQYPGMAKMKITGIRIDSSGGITYQNIKMVGSNELACVAVMYKRPLVAPGKPGVGKILTSEEIESLPMRNTSDFAALSTQPSQRRSGGALNIGGANGPIYVIDGVVVSGNTSTTLSANTTDESYKKTAENGYKNVITGPLSTMSVDVDRASYSNVRRYINDGQMPPVDAVRVEEMVNYFEYNYPEPTDSEAPITFTTALTDCPWNAQARLLKIGLQARKIATEDLPAANLVFLIDVSGSMENDNKLPLVKESLTLLTNNLRAKDKVAIVVYAGNAGLVLPPTNNKEAILQALDKLQAGGSTAGGQGIVLAYKTAEENLVKGGNNRVILATDGDFNVGITEDNELENLITTEREKGIYLTCLGYGMGNYKDDRMEMLADKGNGNYAYIDNIVEAKKTLVSEFGGTLFTVAKDVKAQIEFNPNKVAGYRLVGYENRLLNNEDFADDTKDAGDMGAGHSVTILYEVLPAGANTNNYLTKKQLRYQRKTRNHYKDELATIRFRYKEPDERKSKELSHTIADKVALLHSSDADTRFAVSVAMYGLLLKKSAYLGTTSIDDVLAMANNALGADEQGYRKEFIGMVTSSKQLAASTR